MRGQAKALALLKSGKVRLNSIPKRNLPHADLFGRALKLDDAGVYFVKMDNGWVSWDTARRFQRMVNILEERAVSAVGFNTDFVGEVVDKDVAITEILTEFSEPVVRRVLYYLAHSRKSFKMNDVSRDGGTLNGASNYAVSIEDAEAFQCLLALSQVVSNAVVRDSRRLFRCAPIFLIECMRCLCLLFSC